MIKKKHNMELTISDVERDNMPEPTTLLDGMRTILEFAEDSALCDTYFDNVKIPMGYLCRRLNLTPTQVTLLAIIMEEGVNSRVSIDCITRFLDGRNLDMLSRSADFDTLAMRRFIAEINDRRDVWYMVPQDVYNAFRHNEVYTYKVPNFRNDEELVSCLDQMFMDLDSSRGVKNFSLFDKDVNDLLHANTHVRLARVLLNVMKKTDNNEFRVVLLMSMFWIRDSENEIDGHHFGIVLDSPMLVRQMINALQKGRSVLAKKKIINVSSADGILSAGVFSLSPQFRQQLTPDRNIQQMESAEWSNRLTRHADIPQKEMFYNSEVVDAVDRLKQLLQQEQMKDILGRLKDRGLRGGFTCLLYGGPGTGKTETVLQLARSCGRDIFQVDISQLRSKWYGESEKLVKKVFDDYRRMVAKSEIAPILFFNEADAIFTRRMENAARSVDKGENALQNIILQEMETLDGILIATTNLQGNLDDAFERRFLYKLRLEKPSAEVKAHIWQSMMPSLSQEDAIRLAGEFDFSGGQIENVVRKHFIDEALTGESIGLAGLQALCRDELLDNKRKHTIGFMRCA